MASSGIHDTEMIIDEKTRENWIEQMLKDFPQLDSNIVENCLDFYLSNPSTFKERFDVGKETKNEPKKPEDYIIADAVSVA